MLKMEKKWELPVEAAPEKIKEIATLFNLSEAVVKVLFNRGFYQAETIKDFLEVNAANFHEPFLLKDCAVAVERIIKAITAGELITIYGDYDVDGITSTSLMVKVLTDLGARVDYYIPERQSEGYGLNSEALNAIYDNKSSLLITVDCGISAVAEVEAISDKLDIIITDHHQPPEVLPKSFAIINPKQVDCTYPEKNLAGVGVAFKLCQALWLELKKENLMKYLDLVAIGTVADIVSLLGENRLIVKLGLKEITTTSNVGLKALLQSSGLSHKKIDAGKIGFIIAPRLNAAGRMDNAKIGVKLLTTESLVTAQELAIVLENENNNRQRTEKDILEKVDNMIINGNLYQDQVIVVAGSDWHSGVIGIVASRIVEKYYRPVVIISKKDGVGKGSCRSIEGFNIYEALDECSELLVQFGGHKQAAGLTIKVENIAKFRLKINKLAEMKLTIDDFKPKIKLDTEIYCEGITEKLLNDLTMLEPFGMGNPKPVFVSSEVLIREAKKIGADGKHLKFKVGTNGKELEALAWNLGAIADVFSHEDKINIAFYPEYNEWQDRKSIQLKILDLKYQYNVKNDLNNLYSNSSVEGKTINKLDKFFTKIVGITFENRQELVAKIKIGDKLALINENDNEFDSNAIKVVSPYGVLGYLRSEIAEMLMEAISEGVKYEAVVTNITGTENQYNGVNILVNKCELTELRYNKEIDLSTINEILLGSLKFHPIQMQAIDLLDKGKNVLAIMGTGRGKSAIFQAKATLLANNNHKTTIIIYPLRALVNDQFINMNRLLKDLNLKIVKANGSLTLQERAELFFALSNDKVDILLTTPEFLEANLAKINIPVNKVGLVVIDECHHILDTVRPAYKRLERIINYFNNPVVLALTATASPAMVTELKKRFSIDEIIIDKNVRENLNVVDLRNIADKIDYIKELVQRDEKNIIFVNSRKQAVDIAVKLRSLCNVNADKIAFYHAGLSADWRLKVEQWFRTGEVKTLVATSAFGEGVDFFDVRNIIQYHLPFNSTTFNQQCGRAGRDGKESFIHLLFGKDDISLNKLVLKDKAPDRTLIGKIFLLLKDLIKTEFTDLTNHEIAEKFMLKHKENISDKAVAICLKIMEEIGLLWRENFGVRRKIFFNTIPEKKLNLEDSATYLEGVYEKAEFLEFADKITKAQSYEILSWINKPIYPKDL